jgi:hypothetical protein
MFKLTPFRTIVIAIGLLTLLLLGIFITISGSALRYSGPSTNELQATAISTQNRDVMLFAQETQNAPAANRQPADVSPDQDRLVIRSASLSITIDDVPARMNLINALATELGGWVVSANSSTTVVNGEPRVTSGTMAIRVLAEQFDAALTHIKSEVERVNSETITGEDVTGQYVDMASRVRNLEAAETQLSEILEGAETAEDIMQIFNELTRIRGEIETIRGQMQYFEQAAAHSLINISLSATPIEVQVEPVEVAGWRPLETVRDAAQLLVNVLQGLINIVIFAGVFILPLLLVVAIPAWFIRRWLRRRAARTQASRTSVG